jgi:hypothetical protein
VEAAAGVILQADVATGGNPKFGWGRRARTAAKIGSCAAVLTMAVAIFPTGARGKAQLSLNTMPDGPGKQLIATKCGTACHGLDRVLEQPRTPDEWTDIVVLMRDYGAKVSVQEQKTIVAYLSKNLGRAPAPPKAASAPVTTARANSSAQSAATSRPAGASKSSSAPVAGQAAGKSAAVANTASNGGAAAPTELPPGPGKELVQTKCTICHNLDRILQSHRSRAEWQQLVTMMQDYGADVYGDEEKTVVNYLAKSFRSSK